MRLAQNRDRQPVTGGAELLDIDEHIHVIVTVSLDPKAELEEAGDFGLFFKLVVEGHLFGLGIVADLAFRRRPARPA